jgi:hypothetical protein
MNHAPKAIPLLLGSLLAIAAGSTWAYGYDGNFNCASATTCKVVTYSEGDLKAQAIFEISNSNNLFVTLANLSSADVTTPADVLTALLFNLKLGNTLVSLTPDSASMKKLTGSSGPVFTSRTIDATSSTGTTGKTCDGVVDIESGTGCLTGNYDVGGEWAYESNIAGYNGFTMGIGSAGLDVFGNPSFGTNNLAGPIAVNGGQYGLSSYGDNPATDINGNGYNPVTQNAIQFKFTSAQLANLDLSVAGALSVGFQYGTSRSNPFLTPIPGTMALLALGFVGLGWARRRSKV